MKESIKQIPTGVCMIRHSRLRDERPLSELVWRVDAFVASKAEVCCFEFEITHGLMT